MCDKQYLCDKSAAFVGQYISTGFPSHTLYRTFNDYRREHERQYDDHSAATCNVIECSRQTGAIVCC